MWTKLLLACCAIAAASSASVGWDAGFRYTYQVHGRTLTALHQVADQYTGVLTRAQLEIYAKAQDHLIASISGAQFAKINQALPSGWGSPIDDEQLAYEQLPLSTKTFEIRLQDGVIEELQVDSSLPTWEVNMIKGIVSQLQMDVKGKHLVQDPQNQLPTSDNINGVFKTMEQTVTGRCEAQYEVSLLPEYFLQSRPELAPLPGLRKDGYFLDVVKSTNYSLCDKRPFYNFGFPGLQRLELASNQMGDAVARSSVSRAVLSGALYQLTIQSSVTTHKAVYSPNLYNTQKGMIVSRMNVTLTEHAKSNAQPAGPESPRKVKSLLFSYADPYATKEDQHRYGAAQEESENSDEAQDNLRWNSNASRRFRVSLKTSAKQEGSSEFESSWSMEVEKEYKAKPEFDQPPKSPLVLMAAVNRKIVNPVRSSIVIAKQIAEELQNPSAIPEKATLARFDILATVVRTMSTKQIQDVVHELYRAPTTSEASRDTLTKKAAWNVWRDAVAQAGTGPALANMKEWISKGWVKGNEAARMLHNVPTSVRCPSKEYLHYLFRLAEDPQVKKNDAVYTAALMSFSTLLRLAYVDKTAAQSRFPAYIYGRLNIQDYEGTSLYIDYYGNRLREAVERNDGVWIQTYSHVLGNIAHPRILTKLEPYLGGELRVSPFQRLHMILALSPMARTHPKLVRSALWRIYQTTSEDFQVRSAAVQLMMKTNPPASMLQRMAESTQFEHSEQVRSAVQTAIQSAANLQAGQDWELISNAKAAVRNIKDTQPSLHYSQSRFASEDIASTGLAYRGSIYTIGREDSLLPQSFSASFSKSFNGIKYDSQKISLMTSSMQNLYQRLMHNPESESEPSLEPREFADEEEQALWSHNGVSSLLGIRNFASEPIEANLMLTDVFGAGQLWAVDNRTVDNMRKDYNHIMTHLHPGEMRFDHSQFFIQKDLVLAFPTPMGLSSIFMIRTPTFYSASGKIQTSAEKQQEGSSSDRDFEKATSDLHYIFSSKNSAKLFVVTPFDHTMYTAGVDTDVQINLPIHAEVEFDREHNEIRTKLQPIQPEQKTKLLTLRSRPYTAQDNILSLEPASQKIIHVRKPAETNITVGQDLTGMAFDIDFLSERQFSDYADVIQKAQKKEMLSALMTAMSEPIQNSEITVSYNAEKSTAKTVTFTAAYETRKVTEEQKQESENQKDEQNDHNQEQFLKGNEESEDEEPKDAAEGHKMRQNILKTITKTIKSSEASLLQLTAKFQGKTEAKFAVTASLATSLVDEFSRAKLHLHQSPVNKDDKHISIRVVSRRPTPTMTNFKEAVEAEPKAQIAATIAMRGKDLSTDKLAFIQFVAKMKQTPDWITSSPMAKLCQQQMQKSNSFLPACQNATLMANMMNEIDAHLEYKHVPDTVKNATYKAYSFARYFGWEYHYENAFNAGTAKENYVRFNTKFAPDGMSANMSITAPELNAEFRNVRISPMVAAAVIPHAAYTPGQMVAQYMLKDQFYPTCVIDKKAVNTFNNRTYPLETDGSWHVVLHTAYQQPARQYSSDNHNVTILARKAGSTTDKEFRVILGTAKSANVIELAPAGKHTKVTINNETVTISSIRVSEFSGEDNNIYARMFATPDRSIRLVAPQHNIEILYRPSVTLVSAGSSLRSQIRGLCGTFTTEPSDDFTVPKNCVVKSSEDFVASYAVWPVGKDAEKQEKAKMAPCFAKELKYARISTIREPDSAEIVGNGSQKDSERPKPGQDCGVKGTSIKVVEANGELCFSLRRTVTCHCRSTLKIVKMDFHCLPKDSSNARHWQQLIQRGVVPDIAQKPANKTMSLPIVDACLP